MKKEFEVISKIIQNNKRVLDIGCGGGLLSEPMRRLGANVTGIDASNKNIEVAKLHAKEMNLNIDYVNCSPENLKLNKRSRSIFQEIAKQKRHIKNKNLFIGFIKNFKTSK